LEKIQDRREEFAEIQIVRALVDRLIQYKVLPKPREDYEVVWSDLYAASYKDKVDIGRTRAEALKAYASVPGLSELIPPEKFVELFLGFSSEQAQKLMMHVQDMAGAEARDAATEEEERLFDEREEN
jgi:hypothetical protein